MYTLKSDQIETTLVLMQCKLKLRNFKSVHFFGALEITFNITGIDVKPERHFSLAARNYSLSDLSIDIVRWRVQERGLSL